MSEIRVLPTDLPTAGLCVNGARDWFAKHGISLRTEPR